MTNVPQLTAHRLLLKMAEIEASDLHIKIGSPPIMRVAAVLRHLELPPFSAEDTENLLKPLIPTRLLSQLDREGGVDFSYTWEHGRFRCNVFHAGGGLHAAIRRVNSKIPDFELLHLPKIYRHVADHVQDGLVIICGVTGSGKSSTLASIINHINHSRAYNMITIEDPIEYIFTPEKSVISQREVGLDVSDFPTALRGAVRQDPDLIVIGEMRDKETLLAGLMAAETGHLVFATLHTTDTVQAFSRILEFFPTDQHPFIRSCLANGLRAVMAQRLLPSTKAGVKVVPATEVLLASPSVSDRIREGHEEDLYAIIADSTHDGMHTFTDSLYRLVTDNYVDLRTAEEFAPHPEQLHSKVHGIAVKSDGLVSRLRRP
ncbi:MAG: PilT/PilU family type 4a pilus ATPase [Pirellulaceae bacterium]|nr:PilT/PilU family type 4a pilus ATPase [Pirellulaceae bacterium]